MNSSFYVALALLVAVVIADDSRSKKEAIYNPYGQITDANKYLATAGYNNYNNYQQLPYNNNYQQAAYSAYNQQYYQQQQPHQRFGGYPYNGDIATAYNHQQHYNHYNNYPYSGYQQYSGFQQYPYNSNQQYPYGSNQQYPYNGYQQYGAYQQQYPYGYQNAYGQQQNPFGYNNAYNFNQVFRQAPAYPSSGAQAISPPVPHPFYHVPGTYYPTTTEINKPPAAPVTVTVDPKKTY